MIHQVIEPSYVHLSGEASLDSTTFRESVRALASAVSVIATGCEGWRVGFTATAVCSLTADPPRLLICINKSVSSYGLFSTSEKLSVNVLSRDQTHIAELFAGRVPGVGGEDRFAKERWEQTDGVPLLTDACAHFVCRVAELNSQGTHTVFICDVLRARRGRTAVDHALVYAEGGFKSLAPIVSS
jgi:flavin reductase (DIM6/NTAB) family NADH-FMN oxidoreductase RutF